MGEGECTLLCGRFDFGEGDLGDGDLVLIDFGVKGDDLLCLGEGDLENVLLDPLGDGDLDFLPFGDSDGRNFDLT